MIKEIKVAAAVIIRPDGMVLACKRPDGDGPTAGKWEFPGGKFEEDETGETCLTRELSEELELDEIEVGERICRVEHVFDLPDDKKLKVDLHVYWVHVLQETGYALHAHSEAKWVALEELRDLDLAAADIPVLAHLGV